MEPITSAIQSVLAIAETVKGIISLSTDVAVKEKALDLTNIIIALQNNMIVMQSEYSILLESKRNLEQQLMNLEDWKKTEVQYELYRLDSNSVVQIPKEGNESPYHKHWLCANCFEDKQKSFLQRVNTLGLPVFKCFRCTTVIRLTFNESKKLKEAGS